MHSEIVSLLKKLVEAHGPSGFEDEVRSVIADELKNYVDEMYVDSLGNLITVKHGSKGEKAPKVMISAHMDEVSLIVKHIEDDGFILFEKHGLIDDRILPARRVIIHTRTGKIRGAIGAKPKHLLKEEEARAPLSYKDMWIDVGARNRAEVEDLGVSAGDPVTFDGDLQVLGKGNFILGRALDDRLGCAVLIQVMKELSGRQHEVTIYAVGSVQEEVGARGARVAAFAINPDIAIALDTTHGMDPAVTTKQSAIKLGAGPSIRLMDIYPSNLQGCITPAWLRDMVLKTAKEKNIPYQLDVLSGTFLDTSTAHLTAQGVPSIGILIPRRYGHTPVELACIDDIVNATSLLSAFLQEITAEDITKHKVRIK